MPRSLARERFFDRMEAFAEAATGRALLPAGLIASDRDASRLLRNGLAVVGIAAFEDFVVTRSHEILERLDPAATAFGELPQKLQVAASWGALQTLALRARFEKDPVKRLALIQSEASEIASTAGSGYRISGLAFAPKGPNLDPDELAASLKAVLVRAPWDQMTAITARAGYGGLAIGSVLRQWLGSRNEAAHVGGTDLNLADIQQLPADLRAAALAFDVLLERAVAVLPKSVRAGCGELSDLADQLTLRFIDHVGGRYKEIREGRSRAQKWSGTLDEALTAAQPRAVAGGEVLVVRDERSLPMRWFT